MFEWRLESRNTFYDTLKGWWEDHNFTVLPISSVPNRIFVVSRGIPVRKDRIDLYAIPVYIGDADVCWIGFPTSNRNATKPYKEGALEFLMDKVETCMKYEGYGLIMTTSNTPKLMELFKSKGFTESDQGVNYYTKRI